ncbi:MAG TPA: hypothetical protein PKE29_02585 [Phycisphaerales bacterium]|nr:hypothetical protein [Phycisphaerales bacterium]
MNLREFCRIEGYDTAILTTYQFDPMFFERVVLRDLLSAGTRRIVVLADGTQASTAIAAMREQIVELGRRYQLFEAWSGGAFHAKVCMKIGPTGALVACGSTNLTCPGWLGVQHAAAKAGNREAAGAWRAEPGSPQAADVVAALRSLSRWITGAHGRQVIDQIVSNGWLSGNSAQPEGRLMVGAGGSTLALQLAARWNGRRFRRMWMATGSTDVGGAMLDWARRTFGVEEAIVEVDPLMASFAPAALSSMRMRVRIRPCAARPRTHMKVAVFEGADGLAAVYGSANCSAAAWLRSPDDGGNIEAVVALDRVTPEELEGIIALDDSAAVAPDSVSFGATADERTAGQTDPQRLVHASFVRGSGQVTCVFRHAMPATIPVRVVVDDRESSASAAGGDRWVARMETLDHRSRTRFVTAVVGKDAPISYTCWLEDVESLESLRAKTIDISAIAGLAGGSGTHDPGQTLRGISKLSHWLVGHWTAEEDRLVSPDAAKPVVPDRPALPVTPEQIFRSLDEMQESRHAFAAVMGAGGISLAGIMRLVFGDRDARSTSADDDVVGRELQDSSSEPEETTGETGDRDGVPEVTASDRARLIRQVERFVDALAEPEFAGRCTARQLQQAVAFPLACSLLAVRGEWVQTQADRDGWRRIVRRVCELLLVAGSGPKKGAKADGTIVERVADRFTRDGRADEFEGVIGDGTLWVLLLAVATGLRVDIDAFERDLLLVDILEYLPLRSQRSAVQLAELCAIAQVDDRTGEWIESAKHAETRVRALVSGLSPLQAKLPSASKGRPQVGDWLWNESAGFARIESLAEGGLAAVHIRRRAETRPNVRLTFYVNLRLAGLDNAVTAKLP